jgi:hypothetical protein
LRDSQRVCSAVIFFNGIRKKAFCDFWAIFPL